jgi:hypothetical protein
VSLLDTSVVVDIAFQMTSTSLPATVLRHVPGEVFCLAEWETHKRIRDAGIRRVIESYVGADDSS